MSNTRPLFHGQNDFSGSRVILEDLSWGFWKYEKDFTFGYLVQLVLRWDTQQSSERFVGLVYREDEQ